MTREPERTEPAGMRDDRALVSGLYRRCLIASMAAILGSVLGQIVSAMLIGVCPDARALSVMGVALPVYYVFATAGALFGVGGTVVCARRMGEGDFEAVRRASSATYILMLLAAACLTLLLVLFSDPLTRLFGATDAIFADVKRYLVVMSVGGVGIMSIYPAFNLLRLDGRAGSAAVMFFVMAALNIALDILFLFGFHTGVAGVAAATVLAAGLSGGAGAAVLFTRSRSLRFCPPALRDAPARFWICAREIFRAGCPNAAENLCILTRAVILNRLIAQSFGSVELSAFKVLDAALSFSFIFVCGASGAVVPFAGVFCAEKDSTSLRQLLGRAFLWGGLTTLAYMILCLLFAPQIAGLFGMADAQSRTVAATALRIFAMSFFPALLNNILISLYQAEGRVALAGGLTFSRSLIWVVAAAYLLVEPLGASGVWHSFWIAEFMTFAAALAADALLRRSDAHLTPVLLIDTKAEATGAYRSFTAHDTTENIMACAVGITAFCEENALETEQTMALSLAVEELLLIICAQSSPDPKEGINVRVLITEDEILLRVRHGGSAFNPVAYANADPDDDAFMGLRVLTRLAARIEYREIFGVNNLTAAWKRG